jgi:hypothetical protein
MSNLVPTRSTDLPRGGGLVLSRSSSKALAQVEARTLARLADVQGEGLVQGEKLHEIDHLAREAMTGQAMLRRWADTLAHGDPMLADELQFFSDLARMGKGEVIADTLDTFSRDRR